MKEYRGMKERNKSYASKDIIYQNYQVKAIFYFILLIPSEKKSKERKKEKRTLRV